jgi:hypothetical protein
VILLEFAAQGIRGVAPAGGRATLRPGYNVVAADGAALRRVIEALFYPDPRDAEALPRASGGPANAPIRAGLTLVGNDRVTYRLIRDFSAGAQLHRFDPAKRSFALVSQELAEIGRAMQDTVGVPPPGRLAALLTLSAADLPSRQGGGGAVAPAAAPRPSPTPELGRKRLDALRSELEKAKLSERLQYQLDGLQSRLFKIEEALKGREKIREGLERAESARAEVEGVAKVAAQLGDADARFAAFERSSARRDEAETRVTAEREALASAEAGGAPRPFWTDPLFWAGAGGGIAFALAAALGAAATPDVRYLALLDIPAFGLGAWVALRWVGSVEQRDRAARRRRIVDEWEKKVAAQFDKDGAEIREAMKALGLSRTSELRDALARLAEADGAVAEWRGRLSEWEASPESRGALAEKARVDDGIRIVESRLAGEVGGFVRDVQSVEAELQRLESEPEAPPGRASAAPPAAVPPLATALRPAGGEPLRMLLERAGAELGASPVAAARAVSQKASQALVGLSFQRLQALVVDDRGNVQVQTGGRAVPAMTLAPADRDLVWLALKLSFLEQALAAGRLVAIADDAFGGLSEGARRFAARLLKQIARPGQLVHGTGDPSFREAADHAA